MKKYLYIYKTKLMTDLQYTFDLLLGFVGYIIHIFIFLNLWQYIYSNPKELINGYSMSQMIWYVIITEILWSALGGRNLSKKISNDVKSGNITYNINKPYNYIEYSLFNHLGLATLKLFLLTVIGMILGFIFLGGFPSLSTVQIAAIILTGVLATIISTLLIIFLGLISFFIEDASPFYWIYSKVILVLGTVFPIEYFPKVMQPFLKLSPIYVVSYGPAKLFVDFNNQEFIKIIIAQVIYLIFGFIICHLIYKKGVKKLNVNGG
jgi:ABC-2 type transport system permease protein